jgi:hypothetical protein
MPFFAFLLIFWGGVRLVHRPLIDLLHQPRMIDERGAVGGMGIGKGSTRRNPSSLATLSITNPTLSGLEPWPPQWEAGD